MQVLQGTGGSGVKLKNYLLIFVVIGLMVPAISITASHASAAGTYDYKVSSNVVLTSTGSTAYTGASFTAALAWAVSHANTITYVPAGTYTITGNVYLAAGATLYGDGKTSTIFTAPSGRYYIAAKNVSNVTMHDFGVKGHILLGYFADANVIATNFMMQNIAATNTITNKFNGEFQVYLQSGSTLTGVTFRGCSVSHTDAYGFLLNGYSTNGIGTSHINNVVIDSCSADHCGDGTDPWSTGFDLCEETSINGLQVTNCMATYSWESGFHLEFAPPELNVVFTNCVSSYNGQKPSSYNNGDGSTGVIYGMGFVFSSAKMPGIAFSGCSGTGNLHGLSTISAKGATTLSTISAPVPPSSDKKWAPTFTNSPSTSGRVGSVYSYTATVNSSATLTLVTKPTWASWSGSTMSGTPTTAGTYTFSIKATSNAGGISCWKNWTVTVSNSYRTR